MSNLISIAEKAKKACTSLTALSSRKKNAVLTDAARALVENAQAIERANALDLKASADKPPYFLDRLKFDAPRIKSAADGLVSLCALKDPVGKTKTKRTLYNGLSLKAVTVPMGVVAVIYEARPNVTVDTFGICFKSSNVALLRGSSDSANTNRVTVGILRGVLAAHGIDENAVSLVECDHDGVKELLSLADYIDLAIPRGSKNLINFVRGNAIVPVIETGAGNCCAYIDETADMKLTEKAVINAKTQRISVCNALESLLIKSEALGEALPVLEALYAAGVTIHADEKILAAFPKAVAATKEDWKREYLSMDISAKTVDSVEQAIEWINANGTHHSDVIFSENRAAIEKFYRFTDSAVVYSNASTRFTDGGEFGLGAEIGISTQKLHARGPMGLGELVTYKYIVEGDGQIRQ